MQNGVGPLLKEKKGKEKYVGNRLWSVCESFYKRTTQCNKMTRCGTAVKRSLGCASVLGSLANKPVPPRKKELSIDGSNTKPACEYNIKIKPFETNAAFGIQYAFLQWTALYLYS